MTPTKADKKRLEDALKNRPKISPQQKSAAILNILSNTKRKARSQTPQPKASIASESEESVDLSDCVETVETPISKKSEGTPSANGLDSAQSDKGLSELDGSTAVKTPTRKIQGKPLNLKPPVTVTPDAKSNKDEPRKQSDEKPCPDIAHRANGIPSDEETTLEDALYKTPDDSDETPKRPKRRLDSITNQTDGSSKKIKTEKGARRTSDVNHRTAIRGNKTPRTPKDEPKLADDDLNTKMNIEKIKELQKREISIIEREGTYVQCSRYIFKISCHHQVFFQLILVV